MPPKCLIKLLLMLKMMSRTHFGAHLTDASNGHQSATDPIEKELMQWKGISAPSRTSNPMHAVAGLKREFPAINKLFRKYSVFPATQNADERLFSMVGRMTRAQCRSIKVTTIEKKVVVGSAIHKHGFIFKYTDG